MMLPARLSPPPRSRLTLAAAAVASLSVPLGLVSAAATPSSFIAPPRSPSPLAPLPPLPPTLRPLPPALVAPPALHGSAHRRSSTGIAYGDSRTVYSPLRTRSFSPTRLPAKKTSRTTDAGPIAPVQPQPPALISDVQSTTLLFVLLPLFSLALPTLLSLHLYGPLSILKRVYIYTLALSIVVIGSSRGSADETNLGGRLQSLTTEILPDYDSALDGKTKDSDGDGHDGWFAELQVLDSVDPQVQSAALPLLVASSLAVSVLLLQLQSGGDFFPTGGGDADQQQLAAALADAFRPVVQLVREALPTLVGLSNFAVVGLFVRAEVERGLRACWSLGSTAAAAGEVEGSDGGDDDDGSLLGFERQQQLALFVTLTLLGMAYLSPPSFIATSPVRNLVCMCLGVAVTRAVQIPRFGPVVAALIALVCYDVYSVGMMLVDLGGASMAASSTASTASEVVQAGGGVVASSSSVAATSAASASAASSAMGAVALSKVGMGGGLAAASGEAAGGGGGTAAAGIGTALTKVVSGSGWQPGLLEVRLGSQGRVTDLLGLGDAVFPSLLATFALRYDRRELEGAVVPSQEGWVANTERNEDDGDGIGSGGSGGVPPPYYFAASLVGFAAGCAACEVAPGIGSAGLPALLFIVPAMLGTVVGLAGVRGELGDIWAFDPAAGEKDAANQDSIEQ